MNELIYVADDEKNISELIKSYLEAEGYRVQTFDDGLKVFDAYNAKKPDMMILDIMMPGMDGYSICKEVRSTSTLPILMVSAKDEEIDRILGLELGSDDYISKPFSPRELVVRVKNVFRRINIAATDSVTGEKSEDEKIYCGDLVLIPSQRLAVKDNIEIDFTAKEYDFLSYLAKYCNRVFSREQLIKNIWGYSHIGDTRAIDDLVKRVRKKLTQADSIIEIVTIWGYGYKLNA